MVHRLLALAFALGVTAGGIVPAAGAPEPRVLGFPREGFSVALGEGWTFAATDGALLEARRGKASLWIRRDTSAAVDPATRLRGIVLRMGGERTKPAEVAAFPVKGGGDGQRVVFESGPQRQGFAFVAQPLGRRLELEWTLPAGDAAILADVDQVLASLDVTPYENPRRHVDWKDGWSIDVPSGWKQRAAKDGRTVFASDETPASLLVVRKAAEDPEDFEREGSKIWRLVLGLSLDNESVQLAGNGELVMRTRQAIASSTQGANTLVGYYRSEERNGWWVTIVCPDSKRAECADANGDTNSFRPTADPGPRAGGAAAERFERADAPKVTFRSPARWKKTPPAPGMRLAQYQVPGEEAADCVVYYFGAAQGGGLTDNLERWKGQFDIEGTPAVKTEEVAPEITATVLDVSGRYKAETRPGSGERLDKPGWRMLAAVVVTPDGPIYLKLAGPKATLESAAAEFLAWVRSFRVAK